LKVREYASMGIPTITDSCVLSSKLEVRKYKVGLIADTIQEAYLGVKELFYDLRSYTEISENALAWSKVFDKKRILDGLEMRIFN
jgi:hypothetical protein